MSAWLDELAAWWAALPPEWVFLLLLPLAVAAAGLLADWGEREDPRPAQPLRRRHRHRGSH
ncbi:hypothetical protein [Ramlibacter sp. AN1133]|uniref:hypothetical protein n=1 Tax=Ramlibacter sp. AN1133 TaxID=3133429 RepID=UPI0030BEF89B